MKQSISIITPTYNRSGKICRSIDSSILMIDAGIANEIIVVDDASTDNTMNLLKNRYINEISKGIVRVIEHRKNRGVTASKNTGILQATSEWVIFMDSDDCFVDNASSSFSQLSDGIFEYDLIFFRCVDIYGNELIGEEMPCFQMDISYYINYGTPGECLPMIRASVAKSNLYDSELRGCESVTYLKMLNNCNAAFVSDKILRAYDSSGSDRLCRSSQINSMLYCHIGILKFWRYANTRSNANTLLKIVYYAFLIILHLFKKTGRS